MNEANQQYLQNEIARLKAELKKAKPEAVADLQADLMEAKAEYSNLVYYDSIE